MCFGGCCICCSLQSCMHLCKWQYTSFSQCLSEKRVWPFLLSLAINFISQPSDQSFSWTWQYCSDQCHPSSSFYMYQLPAMISSAFTVTSYVGVTISFFVQTKTSGAMNERKGGETPTSNPKPTSKQTKTPIKTRHSLRFKSLTYLHAHTILAE